MLTVTSVITPVKETVKMEEISPKSTNADKDQPQIPIEIFKKKHSCIAIEENDSDEDNSSKIQGLNSASKETQPDSSAKNSQSTVIIDESRRDSKFSNSSFVYPLKSSVIKVYPGSDALRKGSIPLPNVERKQSF